MSITIAISYRFDRLIAFFNFVVFVFFFYILFSLFVFCWYILHIILVLSTDAIIVLVECILGPNALI